MKNISEFNMNLFQLKDKVALVTGGNKGLGQAYSVAFAKAGAHVVVASIDDDQGETQALIEAEGVKYLLIKSDITKEHEPKRIIEAVIQHLGKIDILVNNAGICINERDVTKYTRVQWDKMLAINITATFEMAHEAAKFMIPQKSGKIINIGSLYSYLGGQWSPAYATTKHAVHGFTKAYCDELAQFNIQVNAIDPGYYATPLTAETRANPEINNRILAHIPANRWGDLYDLMGTVIFLASDASNYINGTSITVDGGYLVR